MRKNVMRALTAAGTAIAAIGLSMTPADAATGWDRCPNTYFCLFSGANGQGTIAYFHVGSPNLAGQGIDNAATSFWNRTVDNAFSLCDGYNGLEPHLTSVFFGAKGNLDPSVDNRASSVVQGPFNCHY
ncbi:peptidase inhibitor family I36 protein [Actinokineospora enzanensis]|uniref:peptidase inhibitor family I36 protein n=1 Tax=Actinokineospora enzanensis TaxID=155975 RepID=UPI00146B2BA4|nr:peptidase inhibitor family I36 protein [Actinokineospora enzanensis]